MNTLKARPTRPGIYLEAEIPYQNDGAAHESRRVRKVQGDMMRREFIWKWPAERVVHDLSSQGLAANGALGLAWCVRRRAGPLARRGAVSAVVGGLVAAKALLPFLQRPLPRG